MSEGDWRDHMDSRTANAVVRLNFWYGITWKDVSTMTDVELMECRGVGVATVASIRAAQEALASGDPTERPSLSDKEAQRLATYDPNLTLKALGARWGVSATRAKQVVCNLRRKGYVDWGEPEDDANG